MLPVMRRSSSRRTRAHAAATYAAAVLADLPTLYMHVAESSGSVAIDSSGNSLNGSYSGTFTLGEPSLVAGGDSCVLLSASSGCIFSPANALLDNVGNFSVEFWFFTGTSTFSPAGDWWCKHFKEIGVASTFFGARQISFTVPCATTSAQAISGDIAALCASAPVYAVCTWDGTTPRIYVNGAETSYTSQTNGVGAANDDSSSTMHWQANPFGSPQSDTMDLDELAFYSSTLSASRIAAHYALGV